MPEPVSLSFEATQEKGQVSAIHLQVPDSKSLFVFAHGAGADMSHQHMSQLADALVEQSISSLRFNFPYMQAGGKRTDNLSVCVSTITNAFLLAKSLQPDASIFLGGHSFGGRMASHFAAQAENQLAHEFTGLVYFSFPLHASKKPDTRRASHLTQIKNPQLFISGTRDTLAYLDLLEPIVNSLPQGRLHLLDTADHGFKILKRTRTSTESVYEESGRIVRQWIDEI
ncbi:MAG: alpha/beta family hydrolase [bacterium]|nr:alpha/beta hydrolase [Gammaproteobacteria bacterium]HIL98710.1 alpha/beta hydrolase [Pseudomonadales bacterium]